MRLICGKMRLSRVLKWLLTLPISIPPISDVIFFSSSVWLPLIYYLIPIQAIFFSFFNVISTCKPVIRCPDEWSGICWPLYLNSDASASGRRVAEWRYRSTVHKYITSVLCVGTINELFYSFREYKKGLSYLWGLTLRAQAMRIMSWRSCYGLR